MYGFRNNDTTLVREVGIRRDLTTVTASTPGEHHNRSCFEDDGRGDCLRYYSAGVQWKNDWVLSPSVDRLPWLLYRFVGFERPLVGTLVYLPI